MDSFSELTIPENSTSQKENLELGSTNSGRRKSYKSRINSVSSISPLLFFKEEFKEIGKSQILHQHSNSSECSFDVIYSDQNNNDNYNEINVSSKIHRMKSGERKSYDIYDNHLLASTIKLKEDDDSDFQEDKIDQIIFNLENEEKQEMFNLYHLQNQIQNREIDRNIVNRSLKLKRSLSISEDTYSCLSENDSICYKSLPLLNQYNNQCGSFDDYDYRDDNVINISNDDDNISFRKTINNNDNNRSYDSSISNDNHNNNKNNNNNSNNYNNNNHDVRTTKRSNIKNNLTLVDNERTFKESPKKDDISLNSGMKSTHQSESEMDTATINSLKSIENDHTIINMEHSFDDCTSTRIDSIPKRDRGGSDLCPDPLIEIIVLAS